MLDCTVAYLQIEPAGVKLLLQRLELEERVESLRPEVAALEHPGHFDGQVDLVQPGQARPAESEVVLELTCTHNEAQCARASRSHTLVQNKIEFKIKREREREREKERKKERKREREKNLSKRRTLDRVAVDEPHVADPKFCGGARSSS